MHTLDTSEFNADPSILQIQDSGSKALKTDHTINHWRLFFNGSPIQPG